MKKVLVIGAAGTIGIETIKILLSEGKYEITALDLKNNNSISKLKRYSRRINIIYADAADRVLMEKLVQDHDVVLFLASVLPPLADLKKGIAAVVEYEALENVIKSISYYNPKCFFVYASSTTLYGNTLERVTTKSKTKVTEYDYYAKNKLNCEKLLQNKLKNYVIIRIPLVISNLGNEPFIYNISKNSLIECISNIDASLAICNAIKKENELKKKAINIGGGPNMIITYKELLMKIFLNYGVSFKYIVTSLFVDKNYYSPVCSDSKESNELLNYQTDSIDSCMTRLKKKSKNRRFSKYLGKIFNRVLERNKSL